MYKYQNYEPFLLVSLLNGHFHHYPRQRYGYLGKRKVLSVSSQTLQTAFQGFQYSCISFHSNGSPSVEILIMQSRRTPWDRGWEHIFREVPDWHLPSILGGSFQWWVGGRTPQKRQMHVPLIPHWNTYTRHLSTSHMHVHTCSTHTCTLTPGTHACTYTQHF